jgi:lipoyl-dependent peroxiredoxin
MAAQRRRADATWGGALASGSGDVSAVTSGAFGPLPVTWPSRTEAHEGRTSPEELLAAAHASCFAMQLSGVLTRAGTPPERLDVSSEVTFDRVEEKWTVVSSELRVTGRVPGADSDAFRNAADTAKEICPISRALSDAVELSVTATLANAG